MSVYALIDGDKVAEYPLYEGDIRLRVTNVSWPPSKFEPPVGYAEVIPEDVPDVDHTKNVSEGTPVFSGNGWHQVWIVSDASSDEISERVGAQWKVVRMQRNDALAKTDWTQLPDSPADKAAYEAYRQQLRDVTLQPDPFNIIWPVKP